MPRENFVGAGPSKIASVDVGLGGTTYSDTRDADPEHLYHKVPVALDPGRDLNNGQPDGFSARVVSFVAIYSCFQALPKPVYSEVEKQRSARSAAGFKKSNSYQVNRNANWNCLGSYAAVGCPARFHSGLTPATLNLFTILNKSMIPCSCKRSWILN